jgi:DNA-binding MarR family transcriptional regulator
LSTAHGKNDVAALVNAARDFSTAAVMLHGAIAERLGLSPTDLKALDLLQRIGPLAAGEIATRTGLATASVTSLIDRLEKKRFVRRVRDRKDRRRVVVMLTSHFERTVVPLFSSLERRMRARGRRVGHEWIVLLRDFLSGCAADMREETAALARGARRGRASRDRASTTGSRDP